MMTWILPLVFAATVAPPVAVPAAGAAAEFRWKGSVAPRAIVSVHNAFGCVRTEPATGREVEVVAVRKGRSTPIDIVQYGSGIRIEAVGESGGSSEEVHLLVRLPAGVRLRIDR